MQRRALNYHVFQVFSEVKVAPTNEHLVIAFDMGLGESTNAQRLTPNCPLASEVSLRYTLRLVLDFSVTRVSCPPSPNGESNGDAFLRQTKPAPRV